MSDIKILNAALNYQNVDSQTSLGNELFQNSYNTFNIFDKNQDGTLDESEINSFYENIDNSDGKYDNSLDEEALKRYINNSGFGQSEAEELIDFTNQIYTLTQGEDANIKIYYSYEESVNTPPLDKSSCADGIIDNFKQGIIGDCWLLAQTYSIADAHPDLIYNSIKSDSDGNYLVSFDGVGEDYEISNEEFQQALASKKYSRGDADTMLIELAMEKYLTVHENDDNQDMKRKLSNANKAASELNIEYNILNSGNHAGKATLRYTMEGNMGKALSLEFDSNKNELYDILKEKAENNSSYVLTCNLNNIDDSQIEAYKQRGLYKDHSYSLDAQIDENGDITVVLVNPHDTSNSIQLSYSEFSDIALTVGISQ